MLPGALDFAARAATAPEPRVRLAACTIVVAVAEGCAEALRRRMADALQVRAQGRAAGAACTADAPRQPGRSQGGSVLAIGLSASPLLMRARWTKLPPYALAVLFHHPTVPLLLAPGDSPLYAPPRHSAPPAERRAALRARQVAAAGLRNRVGLRARQVVGAGLRDGEARVRGQAAFALAQLLVHCQPEASRAAREALPAVVALMCDADATVQEQACYALEALCEHLGARPGPNPTPGAARARARRGALACLQSKPGSFVVDTSNSSN